MKLVRAGAGAAIIALDRDFTLASENEFFGLVDSLAANPVKTLLIDFNSVDMLDSTGLNVLVKLHLRARKTHLTLLAIGVAARYVEVFKLSGLDRAYGVYASMADVLRAAGSAGGDALESMLRRPLAPDECSGPEFGCWAPFTAKLKVPKMPDRAINLNVSGRRTVGPIQGFGPLWEKVYTIDLSDSGLTAEQIIGALRNHFSEFQPPENRFYTSDRGINPGEIVLINASTPGGTVATGVLVLYVGPRTFTFITPQGHPEAGWVTFRSFNQDGRTIMEIRGLARSSDPVYEIAFRLAGSGLQQKIWTHLLASLARSVGSASQPALAKSAWTDLYSGLIFSTFSGMPKY